MRVRFLLRLLQKLHRGERHVFEHRHVREKVKLLEHHAHLLTVEVDIRFRVGNVRALEADGALGGYLEKVKAAQEGGLAAAGGADDDGNVALSDIDGNAVERFESAEVLFKAVNLY